jgi:ubiquinone/menaquinone biosynthesis C-methylase UbiE
MLVAETVTKTMSLNVGCGGSSYAFVDRGCEINCDIEKPKTKIRNFIQCDARFLPFRNNIFQKVYAFNVLEHIKDYSKALNELCRVGTDTVLIRFDKIYNLAGWWTLDHEYIQHKNYLIPMPRLVKALRFMFRFPLIKSHLFRYAFDHSFPALRKIGLLDRWNYYCVNPKKYC